jgi:hypothetical protein
MQYQSILLSTKHVFTFSFHACIRTVCVYGLIPSTTSIRTNAPSDTRSAEDTSEEKSTCPGESSRLIK